MVGRSDQSALWKRTAPAPLWRCSIWLSGSPAGVSVTWHKSVSPQVPVRGVYFSIRVPSETAPCRSCSVLCNCETSSSRKRNPIQPAVQIWAPFHRRGSAISRSEEHTSELQSRLHLVCRLLLEKKKKQKNRNNILKKKTQKKKK